MNRIDQKFASLSTEKGKALTLFLTAGFPSIDSTVDLVLELERGGADIVELGMPFSDPLADGPVIQHSSAIALRNGVRLSHILEYIRKIRRKSDIPLVLMGYLNPILAFGPKKFFAAAASAGVDGFILPEIPLEEAERYCDLAQRQGLALILLVTPTSSPRRITLVDSASSGFLYCVSTTGVTGTHRRSTSQEYVRRVKYYAKKNPVLVGFGVSTPEDAKSYAANADGVIVGSALIKKIIEGKSKAKLRAWTRGFKNALT
jgi:tryptophan synthase alpha chain